MERRDILKMGLGLGAGMAVTGTTGCAPTLALPRRVQDEDKEARTWVDSMDDQIARIEEACFVEKFSSAAANQPFDDQARQDNQASEIRFREMLKVLVITQSFRELPEDVQRHPLVQSRLARDIEAIDASVSNIADHLEKVSGEERDEMRAILSENPDLVLDLCETLDVEAGKAGMSLNRRMQLRSMMTQTAFRLKSASPSVVIDEQIAKVRRAEATSKSQFYASQMAAEAGNENFWRQRESNSATVVVYVDEEEEEVVPVKARTPGRGAMTSGAWMMGIGVATFGISTLLTAQVNFGFVFGMTAGVVLFAAGFITLIVGVIIYLAKRKR